MTPEQPTWFRVETGPGSAAFNMAFDEALLEAMPRLRQPVLRFYAWTEPAASFGYFQNHDHVAALTPLRPLVRRPTGGGLVPHDSDWTYSLCFPAGHEWHGLRAAESYRRVHEWIRAALSRSAELTTLATASRKTAPGQCFSGYEMSDLLLHGTKIAGAAQRRTRMGLLIQGSIQPAGLRVARPEWQQSMLSLAGVEQHVNWLEFEPDAELRRHVAELAVQKYSQASYNRRR